MIRTQVSLERDLYRRAKLEARRQGISLAKLFRNSLHLVVPPESPHDRPWLRFSGAISGGSHHDSRNESVDRVIYGRKP